MSDVMIEARELTKQYPGAAKPVTAVDKVSFEVRRGEVLGFLGPNGAGKTTTMKILTCFIAPTSGTAKVNGADVWEDAMGVRKAIGYLPESTPLYTEMLVLEYLEWVTQMRGLEPGTARRRIKKVVEQTAIGDMLAKEIRALSKGYRQRVGLAQALIHEPPILILDEPMSGLDPNQAVEIRDLIKDIGKERTVILSTHNLAEVQVTCDRVLIISKGKIVADDTVDTLQERTGRRRFLTTVVDGDGKKARDAFGAIPGVDRVKELGRSGDEIRFELIPAKDDDLRKAIFQCAVEGDFALVELRTEGQNLERVFRELTTGPAKSVSKKRKAKDAEPDDEEEEEAKASDEDEPEEDEGAEEEAKASGEDTSDSEGSEDSEDEDDSDEDDSEDEDDSDEDDDKKEGA